MPYTALHTDAKRSKKGYAVTVNANDLRFADQPDGSRTAEATILAVGDSNKSKETAQHAAEMQAGARGERCRQAELARWASRFR